MLNNLKSALKAKGYSYRYVAKLLGISEKSVYSKLNGQTEFVLCEIVKIKTFLLPEYNFEYLFETDDKTA